MIILNEKVIKEQYLISEAINDVKRILHAKVDDDIVNPLRTVLNIEEEDASILYMPSLDLKERLAGMKSVTIFPNNPKHGLQTTQGIILLSDATNGKHLGLMNASYLTRLRTGALSAIATDLYSKKDASVLTAIGTGGMAFEQVLGVLETRDIKKIYLINRTKSKAEDFKERLLSFGIDPMINIEVIDNEHKSEAIRSSEIINCSTRSNNPVLHGRDVSLGTHINGVGSYLSNMREVDHDLIRKANKIIVDDFHGAKVEAGELIYAIKQDDWSFREIHGELKDCLTGQISSRENREEITFFKSVGSAYFDLAVAIGVYRMAKNKGFGLKVSI